MRVRAGVTALLLSLVLVNSFSSGREIRSDAIDLSQFHNDGGVHAYDANISPPVIVFLPLDERYATRGLFLNLAKIARKVSCETNLLSRCCFEYDTALRLCSYSCRVRNFHKAKPPVEVGDSDRYLSPTLWIRASL